MYEVSPWHGELKNLWYVSNVDDPDDYTTFTDQEVAKHACDLLNDESGHICPNCLGLSVHCWDDVDEANGIAHIPTASCWEWQCGHCKAHLVERDSPINHPCYTHEED